MAALPRQEVELLADSVNAWIARAPGQPLPLVGLTGEALHDLFAQSDAIVHVLRLTAGPVAAGAREAAEALRAQLWGHVMEYEVTLARHGLPLPYTRTATLD